MPRKICTTESSKLLKREVCKRTTNEDYITLHILYTISEGGGRLKGSGYSWFRGTEDKTICEMQITRISVHLADYLVHFFFWQINPAVTYKQSINIKVNL